MRSAFSGPDARRHRLPGPSLNEADSLELRIAGLSIRPQPPPHSSSSSSSPAAQEPPNRSVQPASARSSSPRLHRSLAVSLDEHNWSARMTQIIIRDEPDRRKRCRLNCAPQSTQDPKSSLARSLAPAGPVSSQRSFNPRHPLHPAPVISVLPLLEPAHRASFGPLRIGSCWAGKQFSGKESYDVQARIVHLDFETGKGSGFLDISGLTADLPIMKTFFDIQIIGPKYGFHTGAWGSTPSNDYEHWSRFAPFHTCVTQGRAPGLQPPGEHNVEASAASPRPPGQGTEGAQDWWSKQPFLFMRWKERFLVSDHNQREINGASFAGFYYLCLELPTQSARLSETIRSARPSVLERFSPAIPSGRRRASPPGLNLTSSPNHRDSYANVVRRSSSAGTPPSLKCRKKLAPPFSRRSSSATSTAASPTRSSRFSFLQHARPDELPSPFDTSPSAEVLMPPSRVRGRRLLRDHLIAEVDDQTSREDQECDMPSDEFLDGGHFGPAHLRRFSVFSPTTDVPQSGLADVDETWPDAHLRGFYFHNESEPFQRLVLKPSVPRLPRHQGPACRSTQMLSSHASGTFQLC